MKVSRSCDLCQAQFETVSSKARFCSASCRAKAHRGGGVEPRQPSAVVTPMSSPGGWAVATKKALGECGRLETWQGQAALAVAQRLDGSVVDTGSAYAALVREHRTAMDRALLGVGVPESSVQQDRDELAAWRARRGSA